VLSDRFHRKGRGSKAVHLAWFNGRDDEHIAVNQQPRLRLLKEDGVCHRIFHAVVGNGDPGPKRPKVLQNIRPHKAIEWSAEFGCLIQANNDQKLENCRSQLQVKRHPNPAEPFLYA